MGGVAACLCALLMVASGAAIGGLDAGPATAGRWRIGQAMAAPWAPRGPGRSALVGSEVRFGRHGVAGPGALNCASPRYEATRQPVQGLFQGNLPAPAEASARALGITGPRVDGFSLACSTGVFEFHRIDADTLLLALDNRILTLSRAPGALAPAGSPDGRVQRLLERHLAGVRAFTPLALRAGRGWLSRGLSRHIDAYFARPAPVDVVPPIDGDPFIDSQEPPLRFAVGRAVVAGAAAQVPVRFSFGDLDRRVDYHLVREGDGWRLDDLGYEDGETLRSLLDQPSWQRGEDGNRSE